DIVKRLWAGEAVTYDGAMCKLNEATMNIRPIQHPHPPIWFAANNDAAIRRAARLGDNWFINPHSTVATVRRQMALYREELALHDKPFPTELPSVKEIFVAKDRKTALELAGPYLSDKYKVYAKWGQDQAMPDDESFDKSFEDLLKDRFVLGSPEECFEELKPYWEELGVNHLLLRTHWAGMPLKTTMSSLRLISKELLPELRKV
ncbi:MAG: LLM class flavin-dependent oxidoreductase, partial [Chromatiales bacterium]|nr:LLM class flavin-dependent oxidoreductase [Chromatiales bacterium]